MGGITFSLKRLSMLATVVLAATNVYWVYESRARHKSQAKALAEAQARFAEQQVPTSGRVRAVQGK